MKSGYHLTEVHSERGTSGCGTGKSGTGVSPVISSGTGILPVNNPHEQDAYATNNDTAVPAVNNIHGQDAHATIHATAGFTLMEVMAALAVMAIALGLILAPFFSGLGFLGKGRARAQAQANARQIMDTLDKELGQAMDIYLASGNAGADGIWHTADDTPRDSAICAFVPPIANTYPLRPADTVVRFWQVWRSNPNAAYDYSSPTSWYDKFSANPRLNRATQADTDSRFLARTEFNSSNPADPLYPSGLSDPDALNRNVPPHSDPRDPITDRQNFIAIGPDEANFDVPLLRFDPTPQVRETLKRDDANAYAFYSRYPLWEDDWEIAVYTSAGVLDTTSLTPNSFSLATGIPPGVGVDFRTGRVVFANSRQDAITSTSMVLSCFPRPVVPGSEIVTVGGQVFIRTTSPLPGLNEYYIDPDYTTAALTLNAAITPAAGDRVTYQYATIPATDVVVATYKTRALLNISLTVSQRDTHDGQPQDIHLERRIKLRNVVR